MTPSASVGIVLVLGGAVACSSTSSSAGDADSGALDTAPTTIGCDWFSSAENCWAAAIADVRACAGSPIPTATFAPDGTTCTATGSLVTFDPPFPLPWTSASKFPNPFSFTLDVDGKRCLRVASSFSSDFLSSNELETQSGKVEVHTTSDSQLVFTCPNGATYVYPSWASLPAKCAGVPAAAWGTWLLGVGPVTYQLRGALDGNPTNVWTCNN